MTWTGPRPLRHDGDAGFTLVELLIAIVLSGVIAGVTVAALFTSLNVAASTTGQISDSTDAGLISAYLFRDAQSAAAVEPSTATLDSSVGVSTDNSTAGWSGCAQSATLIVRLSWVDHTTVSARTTVVVTYALDAAHQIVRRVCRSGAQVDAVLGRSVASAVATCSPDPTCAGRPNAVALTVTGAGLRAPLTYTLTASLRTQTENVPTTANSAPVPLVVLGASTACPSLSLAGTGKVIVVGSAIVDSGCGSAPISGDTTRLQPTGSTTTVTGLTDPYAGRVAPSFTCTAGAANPTLIGRSATADTVVVYPQPVTIDASVTFQPGRYVFCAGVAARTGLVTGTEVTWYVAGGTLSIAATSGIDLAAPTNGADAKLSVWVATPQTITIAGGPRAQNVRGILYAPTSAVQISSALAVDIGGLVVKTVVVSGAGAARVGLPLPSLTVTPASLPAGEVGVPYNATLASAGGTSPSTWTATGLPPGVVLGSTTGVLSGTPTTAGAFAAVVTTFDATGAAASVDEPITINAAVTIAAPATLAGGQVGVAYPSTTVSTAGGQSPIAWTATGLPAGVVLNATSGVISGQPTAAGSFAVVVRATDSLGGSATLSATITVNAALAVASPATLASGQVGVTYPPATATNTGGTAPYSWLATGLPAGLTLAPTTGVLSGTPTVAGSFTVVLKVSDAVGATSTRSLALTISPAPVVVVPPGCPSTVAGWRGEYYANPTLAGASALCRDDAAVDFDWGNGSPAAAIPADGFSVRWTRSQDFAAGSYQFSLGSDDGARLYIDGVLVIDRWVDQSYPVPPPTALATLTAGAHTVVVEYYENSGSARANLSWTTAPAACAASATGWSGAYYSNIALTGQPALCRDDAAVNFDWGGGSPSATIPVDNFSVRWTRSQTFTAGAHTFVLGSDDGARLYIDGVLVLDRWVDQGYPTPQPSVVRGLSAGAHTVVVEYYERGGDARVTLTWN